MLEQSVLILSSLGTHSYLCNFNWYLSTLFFTLFSTWAAVLGGEAQLEPPEADLLKRMDLTHSRVFCGKVAMVEYYSTMY